MLADIVDAVIGVDTHAQSHTAAVCAPSGAVLAVEVVPASPAGAARLLELAGQAAPSGRLAFAVEGTRSYGVGLSRAVQAAGVRVVEVEQPRRAQRRGVGKSDPIDAVLAARSALATPVERLAEPRADGDREALRILLAARRQMSTEQTAKRNALTALLRGGSPAEHDWAAGRFNRAVLSRLVRRRGPAGESREQRTRRAEAARLARGILELTTQLATNKTELDVVVAGLAPRLLDEVGIGPVSAAQLLISWSHPGRVRDEAAFAALAGVSPLPASSGRTVRHRLNRGGDRQLNRALHDIAKARLRVDARTRAYRQRRRAQGKTDREIRRQITRYLARSLHRQLTAAFTPTTVAG